MQACRISGNVEVRPPNVTQPPLARGGQRIYLCVPPFFLFHNKLEYLL